MSKPLRIIKYTVKKDDNYKKLASNSSISYNAEAQLRLLNGDFPNKDLMVGKVIKLVR